ncbi:hypothetical protein [Psychrobacter aestuarii]|uniref:Lipoprotein n=1 Tax=Psychrobacter aestuarii TaxID=556327 RepID=A0ABN0VR30_9GAMM|nr:hypothetical protein [Psychrobacter aestuarii]
MTKYLYGMMLAMSAVLAGCQAAPIDNQPTTEIPATQNITQQATQIMTELERSDFLAIKNDIHPTLGLRFSMYGHVQPADKIFSRAQFVQYVRDEPSIRFTWGALDGSGNPYIVSLPAYLRDWVAAGDFSASAPSLNRITSHGNTLINIQDTYSDADIVQFYTAGSEHYGGLDWHDVFLVFKTYQGQRYLVAIVNDRWTT